MGENPLLAFQQIIFIILALLFLIPLVISLRFYKLVGYSDYLLAAIVFLLISIDMVLLATHRPIALYENILAIIYFSIIYTFCHHMMDNRIILSRNYWYTAVIISSIYLLPVAYLQWEIAIEFTLIRFVIFEVVRLILGVVIAHSFWNVTEIKETNRTRIIKRTWTFAGILLILVAIARIILTLISLFQLLLLDQEVSLNDLPITLGFSIITIGAAVISLIVVINVLILPEGLLLSYSQVIRASKIYDLMESLQSKNQEHVSTRHLISYLQEISEDTQLKETISNRQKFR